MIFRRRQKRGGAPAQVQHEQKQRKQGDGPAELPARPEFYPIEFDMMLKGSIVERRRGPVRQYGVTVNGSTRLVTSGDVVDRATYDALLAAGAVRPASAAPAHSGGRKPLGQAAGSAEKAGPAAT